MSKENLTIDKKKILIVDDRELDSFKKDFDDIENLMGNQYFLDVDFMSFEDAEKIINPNLYDLLFIDYQNDKSPKLNGIILFEKYYKIVGGASLIKKTCFLTSYDSTVYAENDNPVIQNVKVQAKPITVIQFLAVIKEKLADNLSKPQVELLSKCLTNSANRKIVLKDKIKDVSIKNVIHIVSNGENLDFDYVDGNNAKTYVLKSRDMNKAFENHPNTIEFLHIVYKQTNNNINFVMNVDSFNLHIENAINNFKVSPKLFFSFHKICINLFHVKNFIVIKKNDILVTFHNNKILNQTITVTSAKSSDTQKVNLIVENLKKLLDLVRNKF